VSLRFLVSLIVLLAALAYAAVKLAGGMRRSLRRSARLADPPGTAGEEGPSGQPEEKVRALIRAIPKGRVVTFALLSAHAGPGFEVLKISREMRTFASEGELPWWRVVRREGQRGMVSSSAELGKKQQKLLEEEGIRFEGGTFNLTRYQWEP
jgi:methylated-DNA-protein-cysteine methyltransferase-like protein